MPTSATAVSACSPAAMKEMINAAPHRLLVGDDIRRDDHLAVARANGVHDAIEEGERGKHHRAGKRIVAFEALDPGGKLTLHALLRAQHPAEDAAEGARRLLRGAWGGEGGRRCCCAELGAPNAEGGAGAALSAANGSRGFSSAWALPASTNMKAPKTAISARAVRIRTVRRCI